MHDANYYILATEGTYTISFDEATSQFVRIVFENSATNNNYRVSGVEVFGDNDLVIVPKPLPPPLADGRQYLAGGTWKLRRASEVTEEGPVLSSAQFVSDEDWMVATVPATVMGMKKRRKRKGKKEEEKKKKKE
jgi:hypothetical protein